MNVGDVGLDYDLEEKVVTVTTNMLISVIQDNPEVIRWILRNARAED